MATGGEKIETLEDRIKELDKRLRMCEAGSSMPSLEKDSEYLKRR